MQVGRGDRRSWESGVGAEVGVEDGEGDRDRGEMGIDLHTCADSFCRSFNRFHCSRPDLLLPSEVGPLPF